MPKAVCMKPEAYHILEQAVESHPHYQYYQNPDNFSEPALEFERKTGLSDIGKRYHLPENQPPHAAHLPVWKCTLKLRIMNEVCRVADSIGEFSALSALGFQAKRELDLEDLQQQEPQMLAPDVPTDTVEEYAVACHMAGEDVEAARLMNELLPHVGSREGLRAIREQAQQQYLHLLSETFQQMVELNPELATLEPQNERQLYDVVEGVYSGFNVADIQRFSIDGINYTDARSNPAFKKRMDNAQEKCGTRMEWVPSPSTLLNIESQLQRREQSVQR